MVVGIIPLPTISKAHWSGQAGDEHYRVKDGVDGRLLAEMWRLRTACILLYIHSAWRDCHGGMGEVGAVGCI